jgi:arginase
VEENDLTIVLGGDHSVALGSIHGHSSAAAASSISNDVCVVYVDAHADLNTPTMSSSKNAHGMVMSLLCKETRRFVEEDAEGLEHLKWLQPP